MKLQMIFRLLLPEPMVSPSQKQQISGHRTRSVLEQYNVVKDIDLRLLAQKQAEYLKAQSDATGTIAYLGTKKASSEADRPFELVVGDARLERATSGSGDQRSIQLS